MSNCKMKSLLKGLRYISHMFENEKETEMQIGTPTDVKHVAHIGWDGGSLNQNSPSWMNDFKASAPLGNILENSPCISEGADSTRSRDKPGLPKSSRRSKKSSDTLQDGSRKSRRKKSTKDSVNGGGSSRSSRRTRASISDSASDAGSVMSIPNDV